MADIVRGSEILGRFKKTANVEDPVAGAYQAFHFYSETADPGEGLVPDPELGGSDRNNGVDPTQMVADLPNPTFGLKVPFDLNQLPYWVSSMFNGLTTDATGGPTVYQHVARSGLTAVGLMHFEFPTTTNLVRIVGSAGVQQMSIDIGPKGGFRDIDLTMVARSVDRLSANVSTSVVSSLARDKQEGWRGQTLIDDVALGNVLGGNLTIGNAAATERYVNDSKWAGAIEVAEGAASISPRLRVRTDVKATLDKFDGVTAFKCEYRVQNTANRLISFVFPNCVAPKVIPVSNGTGPMEYSPKIMASQKKGGSNAPMCTVTIRNPIIGTSY